MVEVIFQKCWFIISDVYNSWVWILLVCQFGSTVNFWGNSVTLCAYLTAWFVKSEILFALYLLFCLQCWKQWVLTFSEVICKYEEFSAPDFLVYYCFYLLLKKPEENGRKVIPEVAKRDSTTLCVWAVNGRLISMIASPA